MASIKDKISIDLQRDVLERSMNAAPVTTVGSMLQTLSEIYQQLIVKDTQVQSEEEL